MNRAKQVKKLIKVVSKAQNCTSREEAQKLIKKANKVNKKLATSAAENRLLEPLGYSQ